MGRMINVFELSAGMGGTKLLTDKAHRDGSPSHGNRNDVAKQPVDSAVAHGEEKQMTSALRKSYLAKKTGGTPMKMLIAQEMSKETDYRKKQTNVVARLMGLDEALPAREPVPNGEGRFDKSSRSSRVTLAGALQNSRQLEDGHFRRPLPHKVHSCGREQEYRDIYEVWQQPPRTGHFKGQPLQKGRYVETPNDRRMALVRQKFMEAKRLATSEKLLQSKEFQDALEVLSSNRDLFLKFLEEPNCLFSRHLKELHSTPVTSQTKRITLLKPSRTVEMRGDTQVKKQQFPVRTTEGGWNLDKPQRSSGTTQPTRIVVLKPSPVKRHDAKPRAILNMSLPEVTEKDDFDQVLGTTESIGSREVAKDIAQQMGESVSTSSNRRDECLLSSALLNGYVGDESSLNRSEHDYRGEEDGRFSDSEILSPTSRQSWDFSDRYGSPHSFSSFSRASCSPEPSVIREGKKRISERWSMVASNGTCREQMELRRSSSTLGEMLALPEVKKEKEKVRKLTVSSSRSYGGEEDLRASSATSFPQRNDEDGVERSPGNLSRSRSVPLSSSFKNIGLNSEDSNSHVKKPIVAKDAAKSKSGRSSFKGKVSSLFFSKNKKGGRDKSTSSPLEGSENAGKSPSDEPVEKEIDDNDQPESCPQVNSGDESIEESSTATVKVASERGALSFRDVLSLEKPSISESLNDDQNNPSSSNKISENQNQPSPTSVLDAPFENDTSNSIPSSAESSAVAHSMVPMDSVARTLSWDDTNPETSSTDTPNLPVTLIKTNAEDQQRHLFVQSILSTAGLDNGKLSAVFTRWHSVHSPLDPSLLDKFCNRIEEDAKSRDRRSNRRLLFDCVNSALLELGRTAYLGAYPWVRPCTVSRKKALAGASIGDEVQELITDWFSSEGKLESWEIENGGLLVDRVLRKEVGGNGWAESMQLEVDEISKEISAKMLDELVTEALAELTVGCLS